MYTPRIDFVSPPFHGHLHPILGLAEILKTDAEIRVLTTADAQSQVTKAGFASATLLEGRSAEIWAIANPPHKVNGHPLRMLHQFRNNLALLPQLNRELRLIWERDPPDLAIVDFTLPTAGWLARRIGVRWWTSCPSPMAIETQSGTPGYFGGWTPPSSAIGHMRDCVARFGCRTLKRAFFAFSERRLVELGIQRLYRRDGTEAAYSDDVILALGLREFEFPRDWPTAVRFVGPALFSPSGFTEVPTVEPDRKHVLVTMGTHVPFARPRLTKLMTELAEGFPEIDFHVTLGGMSAPVLPASVRTYGYLSYAEHLHRFDAVIHHGGAGIVYHCLAAGLPSVVWPQDYDQFDFAARLASSGAGIRCKSTNDILWALQQILTQGKYRTVAGQLSEIVRQQSIDTQLRALVNERLNPVKRGNE